MLLHVGAVTMKRNQTQKELLLLTLLLLPDPVQQVLLTHGYFRRPRHDHARAGIR